MIQPTKKFNEKTFYAYKFISELLPIYAFYALLFIERGQQVSDVATLIAMWSGFSILFEIPTGILADRTNRKTLIVISCLLKGLAFLTWSFGYSFWMFALGFAFWALSGAFISGTEESLIFDSLNRDGRKDDFTEVYGKVEFFQTIGALIGIASAGVIANVVSLGTIALISAGISLIDAIFALNIRGAQTHREQSEEKRENPVDTFHSAVGFIKKNRIVMFIIGFIIFVLIGSYMDEFDALIISDFDLPLFWVTIIFVIRFSFMAIGDILAPVVEKHLKSLKLIIFLTGLASILIGLFAFWWQPLALIIFGLPFMIMSLLNVILMNRINQEMAEEARATVISFIRVGQNLFMIGFSLAFGLLSGLVGLQNTYVVIASFGLLASLGFLFGVKRVERR